jgi:hypothetical protein
MLEASQPEATLTVPVIANETPEVSTAATPGTLEADREPQTKVADVPGPETTALPDRVSDNMTVEPGPEVPTPAPATKGRSKGRKKVDKNTSKMSALDAAAKVLGETGQAMTCQELIKVMAEKGYWKSPGGQTPHATLYSAILREIAKKGTASRFTKTDRGKFTLTA